VRRIKTVHITPQILGFFVKSGDLNLKIDGIPKDAKQVGAGYDHSRDCIIVAFEHPDFPEVPDSQIPPNQEIIFKETNASARVVELENGIRTELKALGWYRNVFAGWGDNQHEFEHFWRVELPHALETLLDPAPKFKFATSPAIAPDEIHLVQDGKIVGKAVKVGVDS
jgi:hypothetical protein